MFCLQFKHKTKEIKIVLRILLHLKIQKNRVLLYGGCFEERFSKNLNVAIYESPLQSHHKALTESNSEGDAFFLFSYLRLEESTF